MYSIIKKCHPSPGMKTYSNFNVLNYYGYGPSKILMSNENSKLIQSPRVRETYDNYEGKEFRELIINDANEIKIEEELKNITNSKIKDTIEQWDANDWGYVAKFILLPNNKGGYMFMILSFI